MLVNKLRAVLSRMEIATMLSSEAMAWTDDRGTVQWCNGAFEDLVAKPRYEILGSDLIQMLPLYKNKKLVAVEEHPVTTALNMREHKIEQYMCQLSDRRSRVEIAQAPTHTTEEQPAAVLVVREVNKSAPLNFPRDILNTAVTDRLKSLTYMNMELERQVDQLKDEVEELKLKAMDTMEAGYRAKSAFLANMTHEFRTPLSAIMGYADILGREVLSMGHGEWARDLSEIKRASGQLFFMINQLLDMAAIEEDQSSLHITEFEVQMILREVESSLSALMKEQNNTLSIHISNEVDVIYTDMAKLRKILIHLLNNAAKFTVNGSVDIHVDVQIRGDAQWYIFQVSDTGIGMTEEQVIRIFDAFSQVDESLTRSYEGTGLGLYICSQFAKIMQGEITVQSKLGEGSTFRVFLPKKINEETLEPAPELEEN
ncbi:MAG: HAMP domain-containing sensor histidine kinase [Chloroflexota bacterium]